MAFEEWSVPIGTPSLPSVHCTWESENPSIYLFHPPLASPLSLGTIGNSINVCLNIILFYNRMISFCYYFYYWIEGIPSIFLK